MSAGLGLVLAIAGVPALLASLYLFGLTLLWRRETPARTPAHLPSCCVVVPAHNEATGIAATLDSLMRLDYPSDRFRVVVVADNCTDDTAAIAVRSGATVLVREDGARRGKGWALRFAFDWLLRESGLAWDVLVVIDADSRVSPNLLNAIAARVAAGERAVQATYLPTPGAPDPTTVITDVAFTAFHRIRSTGRERLGLSAGLRGNGMAFTRELLASVPHDAFSRTEDLEFGVLLGVHGVRVSYAGDAVVQGEMPTRTDVVARQRERWIGGRAEIARQFVPSLLAAAWRTRRVMPMDLACDLLLPPLSAVVVITAVGLAVSGLAHAAFAVSLVAAGVWGAASVALAIHVLVAAHVAGRLKALLGAAWAIPVYAWRKTVIAAQAAWRSGEVNTLWVRTTREGELQ